MAKPKIKTNSQVKNDYAKKTYDNIHLQVKKGRKIEIQAHAAERNESLNGFVNRAINETIERDNSNNSNV